MGKLRYRVAMPTPAVDAMVRRDTSDPCWAIRNRATRSISCRFSCASFRMACSCPSQFSAMSSVFLVMLAFYYTERYAPYKAERNAPLKIVSRASKETIPCPSQPRPPAQRRPSPPRRTPAPTPPNPPRQQAISQARRPHPGVEHHSAAHVVVVCHATAELRGKGFAARGRRPRHGDHQNHPGSGGQIPPTPSPSLTTAPPRKPPRPCETGRPSAPSPQVPTASPL